MSSDLSVKIEPPIDNDLLLRDAEQIFPTLLGVSFVTPFYFRHSGSIGLVELEYSVLFGELEIEECLPWITSAEAGVYASATTGGIYGINYAIAASVMLALAYRYEANILDDGSRWVRFPNPLKNIQGCSAVIFQAAVTNPQRSSDLQSAGGLFLERLPIFVADPGWSD